MRCPSMCVYVCVHFVGMCTYVHMPLADCMANVPTCTATLISVSVLPLLPAHVGAKDQILFHTFRNARC